MNMSPVKDLKAQTDSLLSQTPKLIADVSNLGQTFQFITRTRIANTTGKRRALIEVYSISCDILLNHLLQEWFILLF